MSKILEFVFSSKTLIFIMVMTFVLIVSFVAITISVNLGAQMPIDYKDLIEVWKWATGLGTGRNIISDGVMPRIPQAIGAINNPQVSVESPMSMTLSEPKGEAVNSYTPPPVQMSTIIEHLEE